MPKKQEPTGWDLRKAKQAIRTNTGDFSLKFFIKLSDKERAFYLKTRRNTKFLGAGSSRYVYSLAQDRYVIKVALNEKGKAQNRNEKLLYKNAGNFRKYLAKVYKSAKDNSWVVMDFADKLGRGEFKSVMGFTFGELANALQYAVNMRQREKDIPSEYTRAWKKIGRDGWVRGLTRLVYTGKLEPGDIGKSDSWGINKYGNVVLIDYGLASGVWKQHYE